MKGLKRLSAIVCISFIVFFLSNVIVKAISSSFRGSSQIDGLFGLLFYLIFGLIKIIINIVLILPSYVWEALFVEGKKGNNEVTGFLIILFSGLAWLLFLGLGEVNQKELFQSSQKFFKSIKKFLNMAVYEILAIVLDPFFEKANSKEKVSLQAFDETIEKKVSRFNQISFVVIKRIGDVMDHLNTEFYENLDKSPEAKEIHSQMLGLASNIMGMSPVPKFSLEYKGWFNDLKDRIAMNKIGVKMGSYGLVITQYNALCDKFLVLFDNELRAQQIKNKLWAERERQNLVMLQIAVESAKLQAEQSEHLLKKAENEAKIRALQNPQPPEVSPVDKLTKQKEKLELKKQIAQIKSDITKILIAPKKPSINERVDDKINLINNLENAKKKALMNADSDEKKKNIILEYNRVIGEVKEGIIK